MAQKQNYPKIKEHFLELIDFYKEISLLLREDIENIEPILYGSYACFIYSKEKNLEINDLDFLVHEKDFKFSKKSDPLLRGG
jgi:hypothetical protein